MRSRTIGFTLLALVLCCLLGIGLYYLPPVHSRLAWRVANLRSQVYHFFNPPQEAVFVPQGQAAQIDAMVQATLQALAPSVTPTAPPSPTATLPAETAAVLAATGTPQPSLTPTLTPTAIPTRVVLNGLVHEYQQMNNCGPATLAIALSYWGWQGDQRDTRLYLRPSFAKVDDKNVNPQEMADYVQLSTSLKALVRVGGDLDTVKRLVAAGFPVIVEKGFQPPKEDWMGHYEVINGYDDGRGRFITQDAYIMADFPLPYAELSERWWRDFNRVYLVIYPAEREAEVMSILGPNADPAANYQLAAQQALEETSLLSGRDLFFAWFNRGSNLTALGDYQGAAQAYDQAFALYAALPKKERPWRLLWYQSGPYAAYFYAGRPQDVIDLANTTLAYLAQPILEESFYWRGLAKEALGDPQGGLEDLKKAVELNPNFAQAVAELQRRGVAIP